MPLRLLHPHCLPSFLVLFSLIGCQSNETENVETSTETSVSEPSEQSTPFQFVAPDLSNEELRAGWVSLFDGVSLFGWNVPEDTNWRVEEGAIVADEGPASLLTTPFRQADFEFRCDFRISKGGNSGVFLRNQPDVKNPAKDTYELNICDSHPKFKTGSLVGRISIDELPSVEDDAWHTFHVKCMGATINVQLDGTEILDFTDESDSICLNGTIGLQKKEGRIEFRKIHLKPLGGKELFNSKDLTGFREVPGCESKFSVKAGLLHAEGGRGYLETEQQFANFVLHVESNINDELAISEDVRANSGVFFRSVTGTVDAQSNGYEMQIQHDFRDGDRTQPADYGAGGIYRRQAARYIVADNNQWVVQTLIADGNRFATFVNGYQVLDWADTRSPDPNPREGQRLEAGHLSLQGHDPTTNLDFRAIRVTQLP